MAQYNGKEMKLARAIRRANLEQVANLVNRHECRLFHGLLAIDIPDTDVERMIGGNWLADNDRETQLAVMLARYRNTPDGGTVRAAIVSNGGKL